MTEAMASEDPDCTELETSVQIAQAALATAQQALEEWQAGQ